MNLLTALAASLILATAAFAHDYGAGDLEVVLPTEPQPSVSATAAAGFFS